jgi:pimeloyl-ACP methyl ester carboxylesterase
MKRTALTDDGVRIEYEVYGSGPLTLFFQHGWGNAADFWEHIFNEHLDLTGLRCIAASYRGHGGSDKAISGYTHERFARDMFSVADTVGAGQFVVVGFSMAGKFCRYMAYLEPRRILGQVLIAPPGPEPLGVPREAFTPWLEAAPDPLRFRPILSQFITQPVREDLLERYCANVASASRQALEGTIAMFYESITDQVSGIRVPTLVIAGEGDPILTPDYVKRSVVESIPIARLVTLPCGHEVPIEMPKETAWIVQAFTAGIQGQAVEARTA